MKKTMWAVGYVSFNGEMYPDPIKTEPWAMFSVKSNAEAYRDSHDKQIKIRRVTVEIKSSAAKK